MRLVRGLSAAGLNASMTGVSDGEGEAQTIHYSKAIGQRLWRRYRRAQLNRISQSMTQSLSAKYYFTTDLSPHGMALRSTMESADLIHLHWVTDFIDFPQTLGRLKSTAPIVWTLHDMSTFTGGCTYSFECEGYRQQCQDCPVFNADCQCVPRDSWQRKRKAIEAVADRLTIVTPSHWLADEAKASTILRNVDIRPIKNGLDLDVFHPDLRAANRKRLQLQDEDFAVLFVAASVDAPVKGMRHLIDAMALIGNPANLKVVFIGKGDNSEFPGSWCHLGAPTRQEELAALYAAADVVIVPSLADNLPNVICEAIAAGTPVIGSRVGGIPEIVIDGQTGFLANPESPEQIAAHLQLLRQHHPVDRQKWVNSCRDFAVEQLGIETCVEQHCRLYEERLKHA